MTLISYSGRSLKWESEEDIRGLVAEVNACANLTELDISGNILGAESCVALADALKNKPNLVALNLSDLFTGKDMNVIGTCLENVFEALKVSGARLVALNISDNALGFKGVETLNHFLTASSSFDLETLKLNNNGLGVIGATVLGEALMKWIETLEDNSLKCQLKRIELGCNMLRCEGVSHLVNAFKNMSALEIFFLHRNGIRAEGARHISQILEHTPCLQRLNLNDNLFVERGAKYLARAINDLPKLQYLDIGDCLIRNKGLNPLVTALLRTRSIKQMDLSYNEIDTNGAVDLLTRAAALPECEVINLDGNLFGTDGLHEVEAAVEKLNLKVYVSLEEADNSPDPSDPSQGYDSESSGEVMEIPEMKKMTI